MESANFAFLGEPDLALSLGKKGTSTDLRMYDRKEGGVLRTFVAPAGFPEKIQPLFYAINMSEAAVLYVSSLDRFAGEQIIALDLMGAKSGILCHSEAVDPGALEAAVRGTVAEKYARAEPDGLREAVARAGARAGARAEGGPARVAADHVFDVKSVGTVVLGRVVSGTVRQHDTLRLLPAGADVLVRSIQMHDDPVAEASAPARVGLAVKGATVQRGDMLCSGELPPTFSSAVLDFEPTKYYKGGLREGLACVAVCGLQSRAARVKSLDPFSLEFDKPVVYAGGPVAVLRPESSPVRVAGGGPIQCD